MHSTLELRLNYSDGTFELVNIEARNGFHYLGESGMPIGSNGVSASTMSDAIELVRQGFGAESTTLLAIVDRAPQAYLAGCRS